MKIKRRCEWCLKTFEYIKKRHGRPKKYCSKKCRVKAMITLERDRRRKKKMAAEIKEERKSIFTIKEIESPYFVWRV